MDNSDLDSPNTVPLTSANWTLAGGPSPAPTACYANPPYDVPGQVLLLFQEINADSTTAGEDLQTVLDKQIDCDHEIDYSLLGALGGTGGGTATIYRLREGIERFLITDINDPAGSAMAQSELAVQWDAVSLNVEDFNHVPGGCNVLFMDGHVQFQKWESVKFPTNMSMAALGAMNDGWN